MAIEFTPALTTNSQDPRIKRDPDKPAAGAVGPAKVYLILPVMQRCPDAHRPVWKSYWHLDCGRITTIDDRIAETFATDPGFYPVTYCAHCEQTRAVGEFRWCDPENIETQAPLRQPVVGS